MVENTEFDSPEEELESSPTSFSFPLGMIVGGSVVFGFLAIVCLILYSNYIESPDSYASPSELGLPSLFIFSLMALVILWVPWEKLGIRIRKIGGIEFTDVVTTQAEEHAEDIALLKQRIEVIENSVRRTDESIIFNEMMLEPELRKLILEFLSRYSRWSFSPSRIKAWGSKQPGFSEIDNYEYAHIRSVLQKLVYEGLAVTRISKQGNTLYRVKSQ